MRLNDGGHCLHLSARHYGEKTLLYSVTDLKPGHFVMWMILWKGFTGLLMSDYAYPVNIGNPDEISLKEFAEEIIKLTGTTTENRL